jgi:hypothetical protein
MWRVLGERYANEAAVLFDLYTSPHAALPNDLTGFYTNWELWKLWVRLMVADLRQGHPRALCFVSGLDWGTDLSGFPVIGTDAEPMGDLVYTAHIYPQRPISLPALQTLARKHPLFVTEWGGEANNLGWGERVARVLRSAGVGWTAANWNAAPTLVQSRGQRLLPSRFGGLVYRELALEGLPPQLRTNIRELLNSKT